MTCRAFADFLDAYLSGELPRDVLASFEHHLELCVNCVKYLEQYRLSIALGRRALEPSTEVLPTDVPEDLIQAILVAFRLKAEATTLD
jgi:anti-sigma factor RsiW